MMRQIKAFVRDRLARRGWELTSLTARNGNELDLAPLAIEHCILACGAKTVLQVGANDGVRKDPVRPLLKKYGLTAVLVEPMPHLFEALKKNYADCPNIRFENIAVSSNSGTTPIFQIDPAAKQFPDWIQGTATLDRNVIMKHQVASGISASEYEQHIKETPVPILTVRDLLAKHSDLDGFSIVVIDTEGHDFEVVKSVLACRILPTLISYEHKHLSIEDQIECRSSLSRRDYQLLSGGDDTIAYLQPTE
jgi:FkbM family methyltransferase